MFHLFRVSCNHLGLNKPMELLNKVKAVQEIRECCHPTDPVHIMCLNMRCRENVFPERPDQPECQYYMKTGDCKFGAVCKFHHPWWRTFPPPDCVLSPMGLPLRPVSY
jgi:hypothetical protein